MYIYFNTIIIKVKIELADYIPNHFAESFDSIREALFLSLSHRIFGVSHFDRDFFEFQAIFPDFVHDFAVIFIAIRMGIDLTGGIF